MPPLGPIEIVPPRIPGSDPSRRWGGYGPMRLERLSAREENRGPIFGIDTPYYGSPTGWGEWIPVVPGEVVNGYVVVLAGPGEAVT